MSPTIAEFEEKTFENYSNIEICINNTVMFSPGQMAEAWLGFDGAFGIPFMTPKIHRLFRLRGLEGINLKDISWLEDYMNKLPPFKFNLFIQYKRPEYVDSFGSKQYSSYNGSYFRYNLTSHQHKALFKLYDTVKNKGKVVYSAPVFWEISKLWTYHEKGNIIDNSNFAEIGKIGLNHKKVTYNQPGFICMGHSDNAIINSDDGLFNTNLNTEKIDNYAFWLETLSILFKQYQELMKPLKDEKINVIKKLFYVRRLFEFLNINWFMFCENTD